MNFNDSAQERENPNDSDQEQADFAGSLPGEDQAAAGPAEQYKRDVQFRQTDEWFLRDSDQEQQNFKSDQEQVIISDSDQERENSNDFDKEQENLNSEQEQADHAGSLPGEDQAAAGPAEQYKRGVHSHQTDEQFLDDPYGEEHLADIERRVDAGLAVVLWVQFPASPTSPMTWVAFDFNIFKRFEAFMYVIAAHQLGESILGTHIVPHHILKFWLYNWYLIKPDDTPFDLRMKSGDSIYITVAGRRASSAAPPPPPPLPSMAESGPPHVATVGLQPGTTVREKRRAGKRRTPKQRK